MLKRTVILLILLLYTCVCSAEVRVQKDTTVMNALTAKLYDYFEAMKYEPVHVQMGECDFLIESATDSLLRSHIARIIYDHYVDSPVMGVESVAIHIYDKWYKPGHVKMASETELLAAKIFAEFNRQSQIGCKAPELQMEVSDGSFVEMFTPSDRQNRFRVLYFYDTDCSKCRMQTILLQDVLEKEDFPIELYAIYSGDDQQAWFKYIADNFDFESKKGRLIHLWDPEIVSDFQRKYGVLQTPRLFLIAPDGTIIGRGLDAVALAQMLHTLFADVKLEYGTPESVDLFDGIFSSGSEKNDVVSVADYIAASTLPKGDTVMFRQMTGDLLYYLSTRSGEGVKEGLVYLIDTYISDNKAWKSQDDSLKIIGFAGIMKDLLSKAEVGTTVADIRVPGIRVFASKNGVKEKIYKGNLRKLRADRNMIIFYTEGCHVCDAEKRAAREMVESNHDVVVFMVNVDEIMRTSPSLSSQLFDAFDLSSLPYIIETDKKGKILRRYIHIL